MVPDRSERIVFLLLRKDEDSDYQVFSIVVVDTATGIRAAGGTVLHVCPAKGCTYIFFCH